MPTGAAASTLGGVTASRDARHRPLRPRVRLLLVPVAIGALLAACAPGDDPDPGPSTAPSPPAAAAPVEPVRITVERVADGLTAPIALVAPPDDPDRTLVVDQGGTVRELTSRGLAAGPPFLDVRRRIVELRQGQDDERGLLGVAFDPAYAQSRRLYVFRTAPTGGGASHRNVLSEFRADRSGRRVDLSTERELWSAPQQNPSHAAGQLHVDESGRLLLFLGDGQQPEAAQDPASPQGKVLRFDLARPDAEPELLASGMRHPWRLSVDEPAGQLLFSEPNFRSQHQEVNAFTEQADYGWGLPVPGSCWGVSGDTPDPGCLTTDQQTLQPPVAEYGPELGLIVAGAHIYRGAGLPALGGRLVTADWGISSSGSGVGGRLLVSAPVDRPPYRLSEAEIVGLPANRLWFWGLGRDSAGELYLLTMRGRAPVPGRGAIYRLVSAEIEDR